MWVLFSDAARVRLPDLRADAGVYVPAAGLGAAADHRCSAGPWPPGCFPALGVWLALLVGAALAPTDAALGAAVVTNPAVPARIRRLAQRRERPQRRHRHPGRPARHRRRGGGGGLERRPAARAAAASNCSRRGRRRGGGRRRRLRCCAVARRRGWVDRGVRGPRRAGAGAARLRRGARRRRQRLRRRVRGRARLRRGGRAARRPAPAWSSSSRPARSPCCSSGSSFGAVRCRSSSTRSSWQPALYAVLSLTVVRMVPVAIALIGSGPRPPHGRCSSAGSARAASRRWSSR